MIPAFDARTYPGPRPTGPTLLHRGRSHRVVVDGPRDAPVRLHDRAVASGRSAAAVLRDPADVRWSVAYGSNASPARLLAKGLDVDGALLLPARLVDVTPAFEQRITGYGAVPLTVVPAPGAVIDTWVLGISSRAVAELDRTEGRHRAASDARAGDDRVHGGPGDRRYAPAGAYRLGVLGPAAVAGRFVLPAALAYLPGPDTDVQVLPGGAWRTWPACTQADAVEHLEDDGPHRPAPNPDGIICGDWPTTPLEDLPLFVHGTLRPGGDAWGRIAGLVEVIGSATAAGTLHDTGRHLGVATGGHPGPTIHGVLVAARSPQQAVALFREVDRQGMHASCRRIAVRVRVGGTMCWASSWTWVSGSVAHGDEWVVR